MSEQDDALGAAMWFRSLSPGERDLWREEAGSDDPVVCFALYSQRGAQLEGSALVALSAGHCPHCGYRGFMVGPHGGAMLNIECGNVTCRQRFNVLFWSGQALMAHSIGHGATQPPWPSEPNPDGVAADVVAVESEGTRLWDTRIAAFRRARKWLSVVLLVNAAFAALNAFLLYMRARP